MDFEEITGKVRELNLISGKYALFGSVPMTAHGIRECKDIDVILTPDLYEKFRRSGEWREETLPDGDKKLVKEPFDLMKTWWSSDSYHRDVSTLIAEADLMNGIPVVRLEEVLAWKKAFAREKDLSDVKLIEEFLSTRK